jgi:hypothetical protein
MFGYLQIDKAALEDGQRGLYQSFMCGLCFSTKKYFSNKARIAINFDINFFNLLFHSCQDVDVEIEKRTCFFHPIKKSTMLQPTELTDKLAIANVLLVYLNLYDDVVDDGGIKKKAALKAFKKDYAKAQKLMPGLDQALTEGYKQLRELEQSGCDVLDKVCHPFAQMSQQLCKHVLQTENKFLLNLCYNVGKWVYLIDALDDIKQDLRKGAYNPLVRCFNISSVDEVVTSYDDISFVMYSTLNTIASCFNDLNLTKYHCLLTNLLYKALRQKTESILNKYAKGETK